MNDFRSNGVDARPQNSSSRFTIHEDSNKENRSARLAKRTEDDEDPPRFRKTSPISRKRPSDSGWMGGHHVMGERANGQSSARRRSVAEDTIVVEPSKKAKSGCPADDFQDIESDGVEDESQFPEYNEEETEMIDLADESDYEESNRRVISKEKEGSVREECRRNSDATRNNRAYLQMTEGAVPLPPASRKRPREIYESGTSSSNEPISPHRYVNSPPRRPAKRACTPPSSNRRKSAPFNLGRSPMKKNENMTLKKEPIRIYPDYIYTGIQKLQDKFEGVNFEPGNASVRCVDCDKHFNIVKKNFNGPESHCRSVPHKAALARTQQERGQLTPFKPITKTMDFDSPAQQPVVAMANFPNPLLDFATAFTALQSTSDKTMKQTMAAQQRLDSLQQHVEGQNAHITSILDISKSAELKYQAVAKKQKNTEATLDTVSRNQFDISDELRKEQADLEQRLLHQEKSTTNKLSVLNKRVNDTMANTSKIAALENQLVKSRFECQSDLNTLRASTIESTERNKQQLLTKDKELAAAIRSNSDQIQETRHDIAPLNKHMNEQLQRNFDFDNKLNQHLDFIAGQVQYNTQSQPRPGTLENITRDHGNYIIQLQQKVKLLETSADQARNFEAATRNEVKKLQDSSKKLQMDVYSLRSPYTPQIQQSITKENNPNQSLLNQMSAKLAATFDARFKSMESSFQEQLSTFQNESKNKISRLEAHSAKQAQVIQSLEKENKKLWSCIQATNNDVKGVMECFNESLPELEERISDLQQDLELSSSLPSHFQTPSHQRECNHRPHSRASDDVDMEARFKRIETAIPALLEETSGLRDCFVDLVRAEEELEEDDDDVEARLNRIEVTLPAVLEEAAGLRECVDDLGEIVEYALDPGSVSGSEDENGDHDE